MRFKVACSRQNLKITFSAVHSSLIKKQKSKDSESKYNEALSKESCIARNSQHRQKFNSES